MEFGWPAVDAECERTLGYPALWMEDWREARTVRAALAKSAQGMQHERQGLR